MNGIEIRNRTDCCQARARHLCYQVHLQPVPLFGSARPLDLPGSFVEGRVEVATTPLPATRARYVTLFSPHYTALHLAAIRVYGDAKANQEGTVY